MLMDAHSGHSLAKHTIEHQSHGIVSLSPTQRTGCMENHSLNSSVHMIDDASTCMCVCVCCVPSFLPCCVSEFLFVNLDDTFCAQCVLYRITTTSPAAAAKKETTKTILVGIFRWKHNAHIRQPVNNSHRSIVSIENIETDRKSVCVLLWIPQCTARVWVSVLVSWLACILLVKCFSSSPVPT